MGTSSLQIGYIEQPLVSADWPRLRAMLTPALKPGRLSWSDIEPEIASDAMQVVAITRGGDPNLLACAVIRSALTPFGEALEIVAAAGRNHRDWAAWGMSALRKAARDAGMTSLQLGGRKGWRRVFPDMVADGDMLRIAA
jgi:hypothetical protein